MLETSGDSLCLPSGNKEFFLNGPDEKPGYDDFEPMISDKSLLKRLSKCVIKRIGGKNYAQLGVIDAKYNSPADDIQALDYYEDEEIEEEKEKEALGVFSSDDAEIGSSLAQKKRHPLVEEVAKNNRNLEDYLPLGVSYLEMIQNDQVAESIITDINFVIKKTTLNQKSTQFLSTSFYQKAQDYDGVNHLANNRKEEEHKQKKEIEDLTKELMLTSELIAKPIETPCFGIPHVSLRKPRKTPSNPELPQFEFPYPILATKKPGRPRKKQLGKKFYMITRGSRGVARTAVSPR